MSNFFDDHEDVEWIKDFENKCKLLGLTFPKHLDDRIYRCEFFLSSLRPTSNSINGYVSAIEDELERAAKTGEAPDISRELTALRYIANNTLLEVLDYD